MVRLFAAALLALQLTGSTPPRELRREALMTALQSGGYTILVRHARTLRSPDVKETPAYTPASRAEQRNLSDEGVRDVALMGQVFKKYHIPVGEVLSSPLFRTVETAEAFGKPTTTMVLRTFPTTAETAALVAAAPKPGTNRVLVTHHFVIEQHVPGIYPGDIGESEAAVVRPLGDGKVELVGKITLTDWMALSGTMAAGPAALAPAPAGGPPPSLPDTRAGRFAARYIETFNTGDTTRMRQFLESFMGESTKPMEDRLAVFSRLFGELGPLTVTAVQASEPDSLVLAASTKRAPITVTLLSAGQPTEKLKSVSFTMQGAHHP